MYRYILAVITLTIVSCGSSGSSQNKGTAASTKASLVFNINNSLETFVKCAPSADGSKIDCSGPANILPTFSSFTPMADIESWSESQKAAQAEGCFEGSLDGNPLPVRSTSGQDQCHLEIWSYKGTNTDGVPLQTWTQAYNSNPGVVFSKWFPFLRQYTFLAHLIGSQCSNSLTVQNSTTNQYDVGEMSFTLGEGKLTWSTLFSLGFPDDVRKTATASKTADFKVPFQPAIDSSALIAQGATDNNADQYFKDHMGDYVWLSIKDSHGAKAYCKKADSLVGEFVVPAAIMAKFDGSTSFSLSRHKLTKTSLSDSLDLVASVVVNQYSLGTDASGAKLAAGSWSVFVK